MDSTTKHRLPVNVDALMTMIVRAESHHAALMLARKMSDRSLRELCDLVYAEPGSHLTMALRVVIEGRGLDEDEARELSGNIRQRVPALAG